MTSILTDHDVAALRAATPGTRSAIHFNHGVLAAVERHAGRDPRAAARGRTRPMEAGVAARAETETARALAARLFNAQPDEIALTGGNSPGWARPSRRSPRPSLAPRRPHPGGPARMGRQFACMRLIAERAARVETIPSDQDGCVDPEALRAMLDERVRLIALTWLPANGGLINPAAAIGAVAHERHRLFRGRGPGRGQCPSTWSRSAATCWPAPDARRCAARAAPACCTCGAISCPG